MREHDSTATLQCRDINMFTATRPSATCLDGNWRSDGEALEFFQCVHLTHVENFSFNSHEEKRLRKICETRTGCNVNDINDYLACSNSYSC